MFGERGAQWAGAAQPGDDGIGEKLGVAEGVRDALRGDECITTPASPTSAQPSLQWRKVFGWSGVVRSRSARVPLRISRRGLRTGPWS